VEKSGNTIPWQHSHIFDDGNPLAERNTRWAVWLTAITMVVEIAGGWIYNSMALLADGWHMSSHAMALGLSVLAYGAARRLAHSKRFAFGTWKIEILGGYTSAIMLVGVAGLMLFQSVERLLTPSPIHYDQAIIIAILGLLVNLACAWLLKDGHAHHHGTDSHDNHHHHHHHDLNLRSAYLHVMTDAATSLLAIVALFDTGRVLLDAEMDAPVVAEIHDAIKSAPVEAAIADLHVWRVGRGRYACILSLVVDETVAPDDIKRYLAVHKELVHVTVELNQVRG